MHPWIEQQWQEAHRADLRRQAAGRSPSRPGRAGGAHRGPLARHVGLALMAGGRWLAAEPVPDAPRATLAMGRHA